MTSTTTRPNIPLPHAPASAPATPHSLGDVLDVLGDVAAQSGKVQVRDVVDALGVRSAGPFLLVPALFEMSPIGAVPGVPTLLALVVIVFAAQVVAGRRRLWVPGFVERLSLPAARMRQAVRMLTPVARRVDRLFHGRLQRLAQGPFARLAAAACVALACTVPLLEVVPLLSSAPMAAIALFGMAMLVRDGLLMLVAYGVSAGAAAALMSIG